jgi:hypothetical protein
LFAARVAQLLNARSAGAGKIWEVHA